jgi:hypothetical protein
VGRFFLAGAIASIKEIFNKILNNLFIRPLLSSIQRKQTPKPDKPTFNE